MFQLSLVLHIFHMTALTLHDHIVDIDRRNINGDMVTKLGRDLFERQASSLPQSAMFILTYLRDRPRGNKMP